MTSSDEQLAFYLGHQVLEKAHHVLSLEGTLLKGHVEFAIEGDGAHGGEVISGEVLLEDGRLSHRSVGANHHRQQVEASLIGEHYGPAFLLRPFLREGHLSSFQRSMASSSRWLARRCGFCKLCLKALSKRLT
jgi:hypothetical protein